MVLEKTVHPSDVGKVIIDTFGESSITLVVVNNTIVITRSSSGAATSASDLATLSENALAKEWFLPEEDNAWANL